MTLLLVTVGLLWSPAKPYTDGAEKGLILVRVVMTVIYAHVIHSLRRATTQRQQATLTEQFTERANMSETLAAHAQTLTELAALPALLERLQQEVKAHTEHTQC